MAQPRLNKKEFNTPFKLTVAAHKGRNMYTAIFSPRYDARLYLLFHKLDLGLLAFLAGF
jgi:hypothetical protein